MEELKQAAVLHFMSLDEELKRKERAALLVKRLEREVRAISFAEKLKRAERITMLAVFLLTIPVLLFTVFRISGTDLYGYPKGAAAVWIRENVTNNIIPAGYLSNSAGYHAGFQPGIPFWSVLAAAFIVIQPMCFISKTRVAGAYGMMFASYIFAGFIPFALMGAMTVYLDSEALLVILVLTACLIFARKMKKYALRKCEDSIIEGES